MLLVGGMGSLSRRSEVFNKNYHFDRKIEIDDFTVSVTCDIDSGPIHFFNYFFCVVFAYKTSEIFAELSLGSVEI